MIETAAEGVASLGSGLSKAAIGAEETGLFAGSGTREGAAAYTGCLPCLFADIVCPAASRGNASLCVTGTESLCNLSV